MAHGHAGKARRLDHLRARHGRRVLEQACHHFEAVQVVFIAEKFVQQEELAHHVANEEQLGEQVDGEQVVALTPAKYDAAEFAEEFGDARERTRAYFALHLERLVHVFGQVAEGLFAYFGIEVLHVVHRLDESAYVEACLGAERVPYDRGRVEHERLQQQQERHPLVVAYVGAFEVVGSGHFVFPGQKVGVGYPAYVVGVFDVGARELSWYPTGNSF